MTQAQREELNVNGFTVLESVLQGPALQRVIDEVATLPGGRGRHAVSEVCRELMEHPAILPLVVDAAGWNIHCRECILRKDNPRAPTQSGVERLGAAWHFDYHEEHYGTTYDGLQPMLDFKASWFLSDHLEPGHACTLVVPGSHLWTVEQRDTWEQWLKPEDVVPIRVPIGSVMLWRNQILHAVAPNLGQSQRIHLYFGYSPRWMRQTGIVDISSQDPELVARSSPIRRQLLGAMGDASHPLGPNPVESPNNQHWFVSSWDQVPLRKWAEERAQAGVAFDFGLGHGAPFAVIGNNLSPDGPNSDSITGRNAVDVLAGMLPKGSNPYRNFQNTEMLPEWLEDRRYRPQPPRVVGRDMGLGAAQAQLDAIRTLLPELSTTKVATALADCEGDGRRAIQSLLARL
jgi:hypothetical protein